MGLSSIEKNLTLLKVDASLRNIAESEIKTELLEMLGEALEEAREKCNREDRKKIETIDSLSSSIQYCLKIEKLNIYRNQATTELMGQLTQEENASKKDKKILAERDKKLKEYDGIEKRLKEELEMGSYNHKKFGKHQVNVINEYINKLFSEIKVDRKAENLLNSYVNMHATYDNQKEKINEFIKNNTENLIQYELKDESERKTEKNDPAKR